MTDMQNIATEIEKTPARLDGTRDLTPVYKELQNLSHNESTDKFNADLVSLTEKLHKDGVLPNVEIVGIDNNNGILTRDASSTGHTESQDAAAFKFDSNLAKSNSPSPSLDADAAALGLMAKAFNIPLSVNPDGSIAAQSPADAPPAELAAGVIGKVLDGLGMGGGGDDSPIGMNSMEAKAWDMPAGDPEAENEIQSA